MSNILPYHHKKFITQLRVLRLSTATLWALVILTLAAGILLVPQLVMVNAHYAIAMEEVAQLQQAGVVTDPVDVATLQTQITALQTKLASSVGPAPTAYIATVRSIAAPGITLSGFSMESSSATPSLEVAGVASTREALQHFVELLQKAPGVAAVDSPVSNYVKSTASPFTVTITFTTP